MQFWKGHYHSQCYEEWLCPGTQQLKYSIFKYETDIMFCDVYSLGTYRSLKKYGSIWKVARKLLSQQQRQTSTSTNYDVIYKLCILKSPWLEFLHIVYSAVSVVCFKKYTYSHRLQVSIGNTVFAESQIYEICTQMWMYIHLMKSTLFSRWN